MSVLHVVIDHAPAQGHSDAYFALIGALGGAIVTGVLGMLGLTFQSRYENARQQREFEHNREQHDLDVLRTIAGNAAEALGQARTALVRLLRVQFGPTGSEATTQRRDDAMSQQRAAAAATRSALDRLRLQLPPDDELMKAYEIAMQTLDRVIDIIQQKPYDFESQVEEEGRLLEMETGEFTRIARARVGPRATLSPGTVG
jgi:hypothetical protein